MQDLAAAFGNLLRGVKEADKFKEIELAPVLLANPASPTLVVQARFEHQNLRTLFLQNIGLSAENIAAIPSFTAFIPDVILIRTPTGDETEILPNGDTSPVAPGDQRKALLIACTAKHPY